MMFLPGMPCGMGVMPWYGLPLGLPQSLDDNLVRLFQAYASFGDRRNTQFLSDFKFMKLTREAKLVVRGRPGPP